MYNPEGDLIMAKGTKGRRGIASRQCRGAPYHVLACKENSSEDVNGKKCTNVTRKRDWEDATCSVCMEYPHNAVLLLCSSHDKGCRPYMCGTSNRYSNCLDQYQKAYAKVTLANPTVPLPGLNGGPAKRVEVIEVLCPFCRGQVKGWTVVEPAREYLDAKKRTCMQDGCAFVGTYKELRKHVRLEHPFAKPHDVDPTHERRWRRLERERERDDVISTVTSSMPGSVILGDYVIERGPSGFHSDEDWEGFDVEVDPNYLFFLLHPFGQSRNTRRGDDSNSDGGDGGNNGGVSFVSRLRRHGSVLLGRSRRRIRQRGGNETRR